MNEYVPLPDDPVNLLLKTTQNNGTAWPQPKPLPSGLLPVDQFDLAFLPDVLGAWLGDISYRLQCPLDFVAIPALVAAGSVIGRKVGIRPQSRTSWIEAPNLWGCIVGRPGAMKSPALNEALRPLQRLETAARADHQSAMTRHALEVEAFKIHKDEHGKKLRQFVQKGGNDFSAFANLLEPEAPKAKRYIVGDTTYEALVEIIGANPNGVLAHRDELVALLRTLDREDNAAARGFFLTAWNGTSGYSVDRITRTGAHLDAVCLSLIGSTQPGRIAEYVRRATSGGAGDDGLLQRFGLVVWPDQSPEWREVDKFPDTQARDAAFRCFDRLNNLEADSVNAERDEFESLPYLRFAPEAAGLFSEWRADLESLLRSDLHPALESHFAKYRKLVPGLALINHLADGGCGPVSEPALLRALAMSQYLMTHARRVYGAGTESEVAVAKAILTRIRKAELKDGFSARDIYRSGWAGLSERDAVLSSLSLLEDLDWIVQEVQPTSGRARTVYRINPRMEGK